jgi:hypothetical protein
MKLPAKYPSLNATQLSADAKRTLIRIIRVAFPHPNIPDGPYKRTAEKIAAEAAGSTWFRIELTQGLTTINAAADGRRFVDLSDDEALKILRSIEETVFFGFIRRTTVLNFYDDPEVWEALGYEGSSFDQGGYVNRGFNDLDWLPEPRIEESGEAIPEQGALPYPLAVKGQPEPSTGSEGAVPTSQRTGEDPVAAAAAAGPDELSGVGPSSGSARGEA